jgi:ABC-type Mn2+/Zn2+ transport system permease subunit
MAAALNSIVVFTLVAAGLYLLADRLLDLLERRAGHRFDERTLIFFGILLALALVTFTLIRRFTN